MAHQKPHPFLPKAAQSPKFLKWLRRTHAWFGVFGAAAGLLFAITAITLSHHNFGIDTDPEVTESVLQIPAGTLIDSEETLAAFVKNELDLRVNWRAGMGGARGMGGDPNRKSIAFNTPSDAVAVTHTLGTDTIAISRQQRGFLASINRMHLGTGVPTGWIIIGDIFAGGLIFLSLSGFLLWTRAHGGRLLALGLFGVTLFGSAYYLTVSA